MPKSDTILGRDLLRLARKFIAENEITCSETVYQTDRVIEGAYDFIEAICELIGYAPRDEDDDE
jgi:hypothetical protein